MPHNPSAIRILPMSSKLKGFENQSIPDVQTRLFQHYLPAHNGRFRYPSTGLQTDPGTLVLFQFQARIIASARFLRDEKFPNPQAGCAGALYFDPSTIQIFQPVDAVAMRKIWPAFRAFGHVKQFLHPGRYPAFKRAISKRAR